MQTRIAVIVTLALAGAAAVVVLGLARAAARRLAGYLDGVERFATAVSGCPPVSASRHQHRPEPQCLRPSPNAPTSSRTASPFPPPVPASRRRGPPPHEH